MLLLTSRCFDIIEAHKDSDLCKFGIYDYDLLNGPDHILKKVFVKSFAKCEKKGFYVLFNLMMKPEFENVRKEVFNRPSF